MLVLFFLGLILVAIPLLVLWIARPAFAAGICVGLGFLLLTAALVVGAEYYPWIMDVSSKGLYREYYIGAIALIVVTTALSVVWALRRETYGPTQASLKSLQKEMEGLTSIADQRASLIALVPWNAVDPATGRPAAVQQLTNYRWCAMYLAYHQNAARVDDPASWVFPRDPINIPRTPPRP